MRNKALLKWGGVALVLLVATVMYLFQGYLTPFVPAVNANSLDDLQVPPGFSIQLYADDLPGARSLALSPQGTLYVGTRKTGNVYALRDTNGDQRADRRYVIAQGLNMPNGVAIRDGALYVAEVNRILRFDDIEAKLAQPPAPVVVYDGYPQDEHHGWKFIAFGPDGALYVPVGAPCNVCLNDNAVYASITRLDVDTGKREIVARGVRNSVGFAWHPQTGDLWFTDNGRDWLGDDSPPDELNRLTHEGEHFGFPFCHGGDILDPDYGEARDCDEFTPPVQALGPHVAALGMRFYTGGMFPEKYRGGIFIAEHGSWNRSTPIGYRVMFVPLQDNQALGYEVFAQGWLDDSGVASGRPVDVLVMPDGALLVSDDKAGRVYRIAYSAGQ